MIREVNPPPPSTEFMMRTLNASGWSRWMPMWPIATCDWFTSRLVLSTMYTPGAGSWVGAGIFPGATVSLGQPSASAAFSRRTTVAVSKSPETEKNMRPGSNRCA